MVNRIGTVYPCGSKKGSVQDSVWTPEFDMKYLQKAKGHISQNIVSITIKMRSIVRIFYGGACGVMVIVVGNEHGDTSSNHDCISHITNTLGKGMNPIILPPAMGK